ncbi:hypothetical protein EWM64_g3280 [Hericium alpestre]|uniref:Uncharacterized protein n=1 Tax=Hericium alpestre TaxID=135208 RepID=A0A4Z0A0W2_9AGAM|nr:hypothetical protein EWM64_g3280 [Hericium alpestre]
MSISLAGAELLALFLQSILYGVFVVLAIGTAIVVHRKDGKRPARMLLLILLFMMLSATTYLVIDFIRAFNAFIAAAPADMYYGNLANRLFTAKCTVLIVQLALGMCVNVRNGYTPNTGQELTET